MAKQKTADIIPMTIGGMGMGTIDPAAAQERARLGGTRMRPKVVSLKEPGQWIDGILEGPGAPVELTDPAGDSKALGTFVFCGDAGLRLALMSSYQLDHELPGLVGKRVRVTLLGQQDTRKGQRVKDFLIEEYIDADFTDG